MDSLYELERIAGVFVKIGTHVVERHGVNRNSSSNGSRVYKDVAVLSNLVNVAHIHAFVVDVEQTVFV